MGIASSKNDLLNAQAAINRNEGIECSFGSSNSSNTNVEQRAEKRPSTSFSIVSTTSSLFSHNLQDDYESRRIEQLNNSLFDSCLSNVSASSSSFPSSLHGEFSLHRQDLLSQLHDQSHFPPSLNALNRCETSASSLTLNPHYIPPSFGPTITHGPDFDRRLEIGGLVQPKTTVDPAIASNVHPAVENRTSITFSVQKPSMTLFDTESLENSSSKKTQNNSNIKKKRKYAPEDNYDIKRRQSSNGAIPSCQSQKEPQISRNIKKRKWSTKEHCALSMRQASNDTLAPSSPSKESQTSSNTKKNRKCGTKEHCVLKSCQSSKEKKLFVNHTYQDYSSLRFRKKYQGGNYGTQFPEKLHAMLDDTSCAGFTHIISWMSHGRAFCVHDTDKFVALVLPKYFKQSKWPSFQRQLNIYGFKRITKGTDAGSYYHELFLRGIPKLSYDIERMKIKGTGIKASTNPSEEPDFYKMPFAGLFQKFNQNNKKFSISRVNKLGKLTKENENKLLSAKVLVGMKRNMLLECCDNSSNSKNEDPTKNIVKNTQTNINMSP